jgi:molecular chaperone DnaK (HSP70)
MIEFDYDRTAFPSAIFVPAAGDLKFGRDAELLGQAQPERILLSFKRDLGRSEPFVFGGKTISPVEAVATALGHVREAVSAKIANFDDDTPVVLTTPASFAPEGERALAFRQAAAVAGFCPASIHLLPEPVAAGIGWAAGDWPKPNLPRDSIILVYDLGGGTFDAAAVLLGGDSEGLPLPVGDANIGGDSFDRAILQAILENTEASAREQYVRPLDAAELPAWRGRMTLAARACREAKERLSAIGQSPIVVPGLVPAPIMNSSDIERLLLPMLERTVQLTEQLARDVAASGTPASGILLVGGGSRLPLVKQALERLELPLLQSPDPGRIVAMGAAVHAARIRARRTPNGALRSNNSRHSLFGEFFRRGDT